MPAKPSSRLRDISMPSGSSSARWPAGAPATRHCSALPGRKLSAAGPRTRSQTLARIEDDPDDPSVAVERDHTAANSKMFTEPEHGATRTRRGCGALERARQHRRKKPGPGPMQVSRPST